MIGQQILAKIVIFLFFYNIMHIQRHLVLKHEGLKNWR